MPQCGASSGSPGMEDVGCVQAQGEFTGATHSLPPGFPIIFTWGKLTGKVANCDYVTAGCYNHCKLAAKHLNYDHETARMVQQLGMVLSITSVLLQL